MSREADRHQEDVIETAMMIAARYGYPAGAWRLFKAEAEAALARMSKH